MSYKYGLNGNDLNWEAFYEFWNITCCNCDGGEDCDGHTVKYTKRGIPGVIYHDTNDNFVTVTGKVPYYIYRDEYLMDWMKDPYIDANHRHRIREELRDRGYIINASFKGVDHMEILNSNGGAVHV